MDSNPIIIRHSNLADCDAVAEEVQKLLAQAENLRSGAALNAAKAEQMAGGVASADQQLERDRLESQITLKREELQTRIMLAQLTHQSRAQSEQLRTASQLATARFQGEVQMEAARSAAKRDNKTPRK